MQLVVLFLHRHLRKVGLASIGVLYHSICQRGPRLTLVALEATVPRSLPMSFPGRVGKWEIAESNNTWEETHRVVTFVRFPSG